MNEPQTAPPSPATAPHGCDFVSRNFRVNGRRTSIRLEQAMWQAFEDIAARENSSLRELCATIDAQRHGGNLTAALRLFIISYFRLAAAARAEAAPPAPPSSSGQPPALRVVTPSHNPTLHSYGFADSAANQPTRSPLMQKALGAIA